MVIAVVKEMDARGVLGFVVGIAFGVVDQLIDFFDGVVIAVAVGSDDFCAVEPMDVCGIG